MCNDSFFDGKKRNFAKHRWRSRSDSKAALAERIVEYLVTHVTPDLEVLQLDIVKRRRDVEDIQ